MPFSAEKAGIAALVSHFPLRGSLSGFLPRSHPSYPAPHPRPTFPQPSPPLPPPARAQRPLAPAPRSPRVLPAAPVPAGPLSCPHTRVRAGASGPLVPRVPGWRRAPQGLGRGPLGPAAASLARERCQVSCLVPESLPGPWSGISRSSSGPKPSTSTLGGDSSHPPFPDHFSLAVEKAVLLSL